MSARLETPVTIQPRSEPPKGWEWARIGSVARLESGHTPSRRVPGYWDNGSIPWLSLGDIRGLSGKYIDDTADHPTQLGIDNSSARVLPKGTVAFCRTASVGKVVILGRDMATSQDFVNWVCGPKLLPEYLYFALRSSGAFFDKEKQGSTHKTIYMPTVEQFHILLPPLPEQKRIAAILDKADAIRRKRQEAIRLTEELLRSAFLEMFGDPVTNPKGWEVKKLGELLTEVVNGWSPVCEARPAADDEWAVLKLGCVSYGRYDACENKAMVSGSEPREDLEVKAGHLLFSRKNTLELVGATAFVFDTPPRRTLPDTIFRLELAANCNPIFAWQLLSQPGMRARLRQEASGTAGSMPNISKARLREVEIPLPPSSHQRRFGEFARCVYAHGQTIQRASVAQSELASCLTQRAFSGEL